MLINSLFKQPPLCLGLFVMFYDRLKVRLMMQYGYYLGDKNYTPVKNSCQLSLYHMTSSKGGGGV